MITSEKFGYGRASHKRLRVNTVYDWLIRIWSIVACVVVFVSRREGKKNVLRGSTPGCIQCTSANSPDGDMASDRDAGRLAADTDGESIFRFNSSFESVHANHSPLPRHIQLAETPSTDMQNLRGRKCGQRTKGTSEKSKTYPRHRKPKCGRFGVVCSPMFTSVALSLSLSRRGSLSVSLAPKLPRPTWRSRMSRPCTPYLALLKKRNQINIRSQEKKEISRQSLLFLLEIIFIFGYRR